MPTLQLKSARAEFNERTLRGCFSLCRLDTIQTVYHDKVLSYISARAPNTEDAEDLCAEVFEKVLRSETNYNAALSSHGTWLYTITRNTVIDYFRKLRPIQALPEDMEEELSLEDIVLREALLEELAAALEKLPTNQLDVIVLQYYDGLPLTQIAVQLDVSYSAVKHRHRTKSCMNDPSKESVI